MLLERFVRGHDISNSRGPLRSYPDVLELCRALRVHCSHKTSPSYFANLIPFRPAGSHCDKHVWLSRTQSRTRNGVRISNERELIDIYRAQFPDTVTFSNEPLLKIVHDLSRACVVAGVHGGLMYKTLFAPSGADIVKFALKKSFYGIFWVVSESARHRHHLVMSDGSHAETHIARRVFSAIG